MLLGVRISNNLEKYLGLPTMIGRQKKKKETFANFKDRFSKRKENWKKLENRKRDTLVGLEGGMQTKIAKSVRILRFDKRKFRISHFLYLEKHMVCAMAVGGRIRVEGGEWQNN
ncbi:hypothetical protein EPI10_029076 [Gossypium australe]|uniref:Uncharacterized protein n=1 Tax=Gossypium australe TaxID=47621 RepID=A0A5B6V0E4_9ROSI|nr:hypothetical protein EPI10_029076 [Gossypium australe]